MISGLGGGASLPDAISWQKLGYWAALSGAEPTPWEIAALRAMDKAWRAAWNQVHAKGGKSQAPKMQHQALGEYCQGAEVDKCRKEFGPSLATICARCPD